MTKQNALQARIAQMETAEIKRTLQTMNLKPSAKWTQDELMVETALIFALYNRDEDQWVEEYENQMN